MIFVKPPMTVKMKASFPFLNRGQRKTRGTTDQSGGLLSCSDCNVSTREDRLGSYTSTSVRPLAWSHMTSSCPDYGDMQMKVDSWMHKELAG